MERSILTLLFLSLLKSKRVNRKTSNLLKLTFIEEHALLINHRELLSTLRLAFTVYIIFGICALCGK